MTIVLAAAAAALFGCGTFLLLQRQLTRVLVGLALLSHGANLVIILAAGGRGAPTFVGGDEDRALLDPLPQAFVLTAIVITFGVTSFLLALAYRSWLLTGDDEVQDDVEDRLIVTRWSVSEELIDAEEAALAAHAEDVARREMDEEAHR
ncbi:MAG: NADH-quinone oxidoreductase subunit K [Acidimicrobiales bacterium]|nr:NADH-quinone oxidoreductase subunit K [Acidimicrobiales bacterium]